MNVHRFFIGRAIVFAIVLVILGFFALNQYIYTEKQGEGGFQKGYKDSSYVVEGEEITLADGYAETEQVPGVASKTITRHFGNEAEGDLDGDDISDIAFLLTQERGGSGVFYYIVAGLKTDTGYQGTNAVFLGERIAPQTTEIHEGTLIVNFAERKEGEPMTADPSVGVSKYLQVSEGELVEVEN